MSPTTGHPIGHLDERPDGPFRLKLLGTVELCRPDGAPLEAVLAQPKRIALLAYIAMEAPGSFVSREQIMSVLWPEADATRARQSLRNALYKIRQGLGEGTLVNRGATDVGIVTDLVSVDAVEVRCSVAESRFADAADLYSGPFLSGFHLDDAPEFEEWSSRTRAALRRDALRAFCEEARVREEAGDGPRALVLLGRAQDLSPTDEAILRQRLVLLRDQGNRATAISECLAWIETLRSTLDVAPSEATLELLAQLKRERPEPAAVAPRPAIQESTPVISSARPAAKLSTPEPIARASATSAESAASRTSARWRAMAGWIVGGTVLVATAWATARRPVPLPPAARGVVVERFDAENTVGGEAAGFAIGALAARLLDSGGGGFVLPHEGVPAASVDGIERRLLGGRLLRAGDGLTAEVWLTTTARPDEVLVRARASVDRFDLETLALRIVDELGGRSGQALGSRETVPLMASVPAAVLPYFRAELHAEAGRRSEARGSYLETVALDSTYAMAYFRLAQVEQSLGLRDEALASSDRAIALSTRMTPVEQRRLDAWRLYESAYVEEAYPLYEALAASRPYDRDTWFRLAEIRFHWGPQLGVPRESADSAFAMVLSIAHRDGDAVLHRLRLMGPGGDTKQLEEAVQKLSELDVSADVWVEATAISGLNRGLPLGGDVVSWVTGDGLNFESRRLTQLAAAVRFPEDLERFIRKLPETEDPGRRILRRLLLVQLAAASGRMRDARAELRRLAADHPARALEYRALVELASPVPPPPDTLRALRERLRVHAAAAGPRHPMMAAVADPGIYGQRASVLDALISLRLGEVIDPEVAARTPRVPRPYARDYEEYLRLAGLTSEGHERLLRTSGPGRIESHGMRPDPLSYLVGVYRRRRITSLLAVGRDEDALRWLGAIPDVAGYDLVYAAEASLLKARIHERDGRSASAAAAYGRALELWERADPEFASLVNEARQGVERNGALPGR